MKKTKSLITYQNLNSGKRLINGRNSSLPLDGKVGPSSSKITSLKTYPRLFPTYPAIILCDFKTMDVRKIFHSRGTYTNTIHKKFEGRFKLLCFNKHQLIHDT